MLTRLQALLTTALAAGVLVAAPASVRAEMDTMEARETTEIDADEDLYDSDFGVETSTEVTDRNVSADTTDVDMDMDSDFERSSFDSGDDMDSMQMRESMEMDDDMDMDMSRESEFSSTPVRGLW